MNDEVKELRRRFALLRDEELLKILTTRRAQYRQTALDAAAEELTRRGVAFTRPAGGFTPHAYAHAPARPARNGRGWEFWLGIFLIGGACLWLDEWVDGMTPGTAYEPLRVIFLVLLSVAGGRLMRLWESVD